METAGLDFNSQRGQHLSDDVAILRPHRGIGSPRINPMGRFSVPTA